MSGTLIRAEDEADTTSGGYGTDPIVREAHKRFKYCEERESVARERMLADYMFANGDSDNNYQWPDQLYAARTNSDRPALTINKTHQHNLQIINDAKQKKSGIKYRPVGDGATVEAANILEGIVRHIQDVSNANMHRGVAIEFQVDAGLGYTRIVTDYEHARTFDQEIYIRSVPDPWACYLDPDAVELDGSDARYGFIFADRPREEVEKEYPDYAAQISANNVVDGSDAKLWRREKTVRVCEYYRIEEVPDELIASPDGTSILRSQINEALLKSWEEAADARMEKLRRRDIVRKQLWWHKIVGSAVVEERQQPGRSIPIVPYVGQQIVINNVLDRKGHTRGLKDAQRMLNYNRSASVEFGALQSKSPWIADVRAIEGYEEYWRTANTENHSVLPYNGLDDNGQPLPKPERQQPPQSAPAFLDGAQAAERDMMMASGQYEAEMGAPSNEVSGRAINERQRQGDRATYHFIDNQALAIRREGQIILELIPEVYDTRRAKRILGKDGSEDHVTIDPSCDTACQQLADGMVFNPTVGQYAVVSDVGPDYATQRQEAWNAISQIIISSPELVNRIGDLLFKTADFPLSDEIAERLKPGLPPEAQKALALLQADKANLTKLLQESMQALTEERLKVKGQDNDLAIKAFDADTKRLSVFKDMLPMDPAAMQAMIHETVRQALQDNLGPIVMHLKAAGAVDTSPEGPPGATGALPLRTPDVGQQAAQPGGM